MRGAVAAVGLVRAWTVISVGRVDTYNQLVVVVVVVVAGANDSKDQKIVDLKEELHVVVVADG